MNSPGFSTELGASGTERRHRFRVSVPGPDDLDGIFACRVPVSMEMTPTGCNIAENHPLPTRPSKETFSRKPNAILFEPPQSQSVMLLLSLAAACPAAASDAPGLAHGHSCEEVRPVALLVRDFMEFRTFSTQFFSYANCLMKIRQLNVYH